MKQPFPREWEEILRGNVALYQHLPADLRERLHGYINVFLDEKKFEGSKLCCLGEDSGQGVRGTR
ncbi:MAG: zinc-dependent peptidase [Nitrospirota bacterium]|nr:zinc-dependent peptidase [Nitrospirota bacterium]